MAASSATIKSVIKVVDEASPQLKAIADNHKKVSASVKQQRDAQKLLNDINNRAVDVEKRTLTLKQQYHRELEKLTTAFRKGTISTKQHAQAVRTLRGTYANLSKQAASTAEAVTFMGRSMSRQMRAGFGQLGHQVQDVAVQLQMGQNALLVFAQQGSQIASLFGAGGAIVGGVMAVGGALAMALIPNLAESKKTAGELREELLGLSSSFDTLTTSQQSAVKSMSALELDEMKTRLSDAREELEGLTSASLTNLLAQNDILFSWKEHSNDIARQKALIELLASEVDHYTETLDVLNGKLGMTSREARQWINELENANAVFGMTDYEKQLEQISKMPEQYRLAARHALDLSVALQHVKDQQEREESLADMDIDRVERENKRIFERSKEMVAAEKRASDYMRKIRAEDAKFIAQIEREEMQEIERNRAELESLRLIGEETALKDSYQRQLDIVKQYVADKTITLKEGAEATRRIEERRQKDAISEGKKGLDALAQYNKKAFYLNKAVRVGEAIMDTYAGANKALAAYPPPFSYIAAAGQVAFGMAQVAQIKSQNFGGRATGGLVQEGRPYMVGESGKEMFVPNTSGRIVNNSDVNAMGGTNINFNITTVDARGFDELLNSRRGQIVSMVNRAMNDRGRVGVTA